MEENRLKISNPERVARILQKICEASLQVIVRCEDQVGIAVRGRASNTTAQQGKLFGMRISNISERGMEHLGAREVVVVEFVMASAKVMFRSFITAREQGAIIINMPASLVSVERRKNARFAAKLDVAAFLQLSVWTPNDEDLAAPPVFNHCLGWGQRVQITDVSYGGLSGITRFPSLYGVLRRGLIDDNALLITPMQPEISVGLEFRWGKRIREHVEGQEGDVHSQRSYRFGAQFINPSPQAKATLLQFIQLLSRAEAI